MAQIFCNFTVFSRLMFSIGIGGAAILKKTTSNHVLCSLCLVLLFLITGCSQTDSEDNSDSCTSAGATASSKLPSLNGYLPALNLSTDLNTIYTIDYQENVAGQIAGLKSENDYTAG